MPGSDDDMGQVLRCLWLEKVMMGHMNKYDTRRKDARNKKVKITDRGAQTGELMPGKNGTGESFKEEYCTH